MKIDQIALFYVFAVLSIIIQILCFCEINTYFKL